MLSDTASLSNSPQPTKAPYIPPHMRPKRVGGKGYYTYGTLREFPKEYEMSYVLCLACVANNERTAQHRPLDMQLHLLTKHSLTLGGYADLYDQNASYVGGLLAYWWPGDSESEDD
jgi:hypothetical protein